MSRIISFAKSSFYMAALVGLLSAALALYFLHIETSLELSRISAERQKAEIMLDQLRSDGDAAKQIRGQLNVEEARRLLAPVERLTAAAAIERAASASHLVHFTYTLAPEKPVKIDDNEILAISSISLGADAPDDIAVYQFMGELSHVLPGRLRVTDLEIERADAALTSANVHFKATLEWLSNGSLKTVAGNP